MDTIRSRGCRSVIRAVALGALLFVAVALVPGEAHADPLTSNPYKGQFASPNCTWYAWQRLHDTEHIDLQFSADAGYWIDFTAQPRSAWDEISGTYVQAQINTTPAPGDVVVLPFASDWANPSHVAYVESVGPSGNFDISEQSYGDYSPGTNTQPYPYVRHKTWNLDQLQAAEQGRARFLHFVEAAPQPVDDFELVDEGATAGVALNQTAHVIIQLANTGTTTWSQSAGYQLDEISANCVTCDASRVTLHLGAVSVPPQGVWKAEVDLSTGPGQMCPVSSASSACDPITTSCVSTCYLLPVFVMMHGSSAFGPALPLSIPLVAGTPSPTPGAPTATPSSPTVVASPTLPAATPTVIVAQPGDNAVVIGQSQPPEVQAAQHVPIFFLLQNGGTTTWSDANSYTLACTATCMGAATSGFGGQAVAPGQQYPFNITLTSPTTPGTYRTWWILEHNGAPFGPGLFIDVTVQGWSPLLQQPAPTCGNPVGTVWFNPLPDATQSASCDSSGYHLQQTTAQSYAETDLKLVNNAPYDQTSFRASVLFTFESPSDAATYAAMIVQTPQDPKQAGGYIFAVGPTGRWRLQAISSQSVIVNVAEGSVSAAASATMSVAVRNGQLTASLNGQPVVMWSDSLGANTELGLMVERDNASPSSVVRYNAFELDRWG